MPAFFGGVSLTESGTVSNVGAVALAYFLDSREQWQLDLGTEWEAQFLKDVQALSEIYAPDLEVYKTSHI